MVPLWSQRAQVQTGGKFESESQPCTEAVCTSIYVYILYVLCYAYIYIYIYLSLSLSLLYLYYSVRSVFYILYSEPAG